MSTYTFIADYRGGTYLWQKEAADVRTACFLWKDEVAKSGNVPKLDGEAFSKSFNNYIDELPPYPLSALANVWAFDLLIKKHMLFLHIVQTETTAVPVKAPDPASPRRVPA